MWIVTLRVLSIFFLIGLGYLARRRDVLDGATTRRLARVLTSFFYPALIYSAIVLDFSAQSLARLWQLPAGTYGIMTVGFCVGFCLIRWFGGRETVRGRSFHFQATINNYSFLAMPIALFLWGERAMALVALSSLGSEIAVWTLGVFSLTEKRPPMEALKHLMSPPICAIAAGLATLVLRDLTGVPQVLRGMFGGGLLDVYTAFVDSLRLFGGATIPVAMMMVGSRMVEIEPRYCLGRDLYWTALVRLVLVPAIVIGLLRLLPVGVEVYRTLVLVGVMPSAVASVVLGEMYGGDVRYASATVFVTHVMGLVTIPVWMVLVLG